MVRRLLYNMLSCVRRGIARNSCLIQRKQDCQWGSVASLSVIHYQGRDVQTSANDHGAHSCPCQQLQQERVLLPAINDVSC